MNERDRQRMIDRYLARLQRELDDVPREARRELLEDVRSHIEEAWAASPEHDQAALERILGRLGTPAALAQEEREKLGLGAPERRLDLLGWAAIVLTAVFTPVGLLLAWISSHWRTRDKAIATGIVLAGLALVFTVSFAGFFAFQRPVVVVDVQTVEAQPAPPGQAGVTSAARINSTPSLPVALVLAGLWGAPLVAATYLALRVRRPARRPLVLVPVVVATLFFLACSLIILLPLTHSTVAGSNLEGPAPARTLEAAP